MRSIEEAPPEEQERPRQPRIRVIGASRSHRVRIEMLLDRFLPIVMERLTAEGCPQPRRLVVVGHPRVGHEHNRGELTTTRTATAWIWLNPHEDPDTLAWVMAHELGHAMLAAQAGWPIWPRQTTVGERIASEFVAEHLASGLCSDAAPTLLLDDALAVADQWFRMRGRARRMGSVAPGPLDFECVRTEIDELGRQYAYALAASRLADDSEASRLATWLAQRPILGEIVAPLTAAVAMLGAEPSLTSCSQMVATTGSTIDERRAEVFARPHALRAIAV